MGILISYVFGAASATFLIVFVLRRQAGGDGVVIDSLGEVRGLLDGVSRQQERLVTQATQWNQLLGHTGERGQWGELTLQNLVEAAGLRRHVDFDLQVHVSNGDGTARPDLVLHLPGGGSIPVDSKATWGAFQESLSVADPNGREGLLCKHARSVRSCVRDLASRDYASLFAHAPEAVVLFIPSEAVFAAAVAHDPELLDFAIRQRVVIATPTTLFGLLQVIAVGWHQVELSENAQRIQQLGAQLLKQLSGMAKQLAKASRGLDSAVRAHNEAVSCFEGKLVDTARRMGQLGVAGSAQLEAPSPAAVSVRQARDEELTD